MVMVPRSVTPQIDVGAAPAGRFEAPESINYGAQTAQQMGQGLSQTSGNLSRIANELTQQANADRFDDAANKAANFALDLRYGKQSGYTNITGEAALNRPDGKPLADEYTDKLSEHLIALSDSLGNDEQKAMFSRFSRDLTLKFRGEAMHYEAQQNTVYRGSVAEATQDTAVREIGLSWNDPQAVDSAVARIRAASRQQAELTGRAPEWADAKALDLTSRGHAMALGAAIDRGDVAAADGYLKRYASQMSADAVIKAREAISKQDSAIVVNGAVERTFTKYAPDFSGSDANRALNILWGSESNFRQFDKNGSVLVSEKGARGISQVLPTTGPEAAKLAGLKWDAELFHRKLTGDPVKDQEAIEYNKQLGKAYFTKQVQEFGSLDKAYAAYNAGPGALKDAIKKADKGGGSYLDYLPKETQNYVKNNITAFNSGKGRGIPSQKAVEESAVAELGPLATEPQKQAAIQQSRQRYAALSASVKEQEYSIATNAITTLAQNGGDWAALPASVRDNIPFNLVDKVKGYADRVATGKVRTNTAVYDQLTNPNFLVKLSDAEFGMMQADLEPKDFKQFAQERMALRSGKALNAAGDVPRDSINATLTNKLGTLGIYDDVRKDDMRMGAVKQFVSNSVLEAQAGLGRKMNDQEVEKHINGLFLRSFQFKNTLMGVEYGNVKAMPYLSMKYGDIPASERTAIEDGLKARGISNPTQGDTLGVYLNMKMRNGNG